MNLKIKGTYKPGHCQLVVGESVPFSFRAYQGVLPAPYLFLAGTKTSLLELKIDKCLLAVVGVTLTLFNKPFRTGIPTAYDNVEAINGLPVISVDYFSSVSHGEHSQRNENCDFELTKDQNKYLVLLDNKVCPTRCFRIDRIGFYEANGELCGIGFFEMSLDETGKLRKFFNLA